MILKLTVSSSRLYPILISFFLFYHAVKSQSTTTQTSCFSLKDSIACPDFDNYFMASVQNFFLDVKSFDGFLLSYFDNNSSFQKQWGNRFDCMGWNGHDMRFHISTMCNLFLSKSKCQQPITLVPLCKSSCMTWLNSTQKIFNNSQFCNSNPNKDVSNKREMHLLSSSDKLFCDSLGDDGVCSIGLKFESNQCGFFEWSDALTFCKDPANINESCCSLVNNKMLDDAVKGLAPINPAVWLISGLVSLVMLIFGILFIVYVKTGKWKEKCVSAFVPGESTSGTILRSRGTNEMSNTSASGGTIYLDQPKSIFTNEGRRSLFAKSMIAVKKASFLPMGTNHQSSNESVSVTLPSADSLYKKGRAVSQCVFSQKNESNVGKRMMAIESYNPCLPDEMVLEKDDVILIEEEYDDGWAFGKNETSGGSGAFPVISLKPIPLGEVFSKRFNSILNFSFDRSKEEK